MIPWTKDKLRSFDVGSRKVMPIKESMHLKSSDPRLYISLWQGGREILNLECSHKRIEGGEGAFLYKAVEKAAETLGFEILISGVRKMYQTLSNRGTHS